MTAKERRSKRRQELWELLRKLMQREKDAGVGSALNKPCTPEQLAFLRQEQAKLRKELGHLDKGFAKQRAWSQGKLNY
jgi:hypothetical protein